MSLWSKFKSNVESYIERKLKEQAQARGTNMRDFSREFADDFDERMRERSEKNSMKIVFHKRVEDADPETAQALREKMGIGTVEGYEIPDLWKAQRTLNPNFKVIDFSAAKDRLEQEVWKPTQVTRIADNILSRITQESDVDAEDGEDYIYYSWEVTSLELQISVTGTSITLDQAKRNCDLSAQYVSTVNGPGEGTKE